MITSGHRALVSIVTFTVLTATAVLGACAHPQSVATSEPAARASFRFDNESETSVDVYLVTDQRAWRLGRVASGARTDLRIPDTALPATAGFLRLAVLAGGPVTLQPATDPHAILTIAQPLSVLLSQRWTFAQSQGGSPQILGVRADGRP